MSHLLQAYAVLASSSPRSEVAAVLHAIVNAQPFEIDEPERREIIQTILADLAKCTSSHGKGRLATKDAALALLTIKTLGRVPAGSAVIATSSNLSLLLNISSSLKDHTDASNEALRCIANALLLIEAARTTFVQKDIGGGDICVELLEKSTSPERIFLASRILFLCTHSILSWEFTRSLVESKPPGHSSNIITIIGNRLDGLMSDILGSTKLAREAMTDLLKLTFNLLSHYPKIVDDDVQRVKGSSSNGPSDKVIGDNWSDRLDGILSPLLRAFNNLPPTFPAPLAAPMTHVIHSLITIPISPTLHSKWFPLSPPTSLHTPSPKGLRDSPTSASPDASTSRLSPGSRSDSPTSATKEKPGALDRAFSKLSAGRRSLSLSRSSSPPHQITHDVVRRACDLLDVSLTHYMPGAVEPDDASVRERCRQEGDNSFDEIMSPLVVLITKICNADEASRRRVRDRLVPEDLDRTTPLETRADLLGRCLRILASVHHPRMKDATGEMLFAACDSDASILASLVGYGNVAGFLFNKGIMSAPPRSSGASIPVATPAGVPINPITGIAEVKVEPPEMTDEEKEREAEKLFVLFDRLERAGGIAPSQNPIRKAVQEGKLG